MKYLIHTIQKGAGCDYTIGCGHSVRIKEADSIDKMYHRVIQELMMDEPCYLAKDMERLRIYEISQVAEVPLDRVILARDQLAEEAARNTQEAKDRANYERLRKKYERGDK
jgi:hypothetical protein